MVLEQQDHWLGQALGPASRYHLEALLGQGRMSRVYRSLDHKLSIGDHSVYRAIKLLDIDLAASMNGRERFRREMQACILLQDSRIVNVFDYGSVRSNSGTDHAIERPFIVMELIEGITLEVMLSQIGPLPVPQAVDLACQIATGLTVIHQGITLQGRTVRFVHRDLKPANIFLLQDAEGQTQVKISDFGCVKFLGDVNFVALPQTGQYGGTLTYSSPEQIQGSKELDSRADIYSLGCILYRMVGNSNPFKLGPQASDIDWMTAHLKQHPVGFDPALHIPASLETLVLKCLRKDPSDRFSSATELESALRAVQSQLTLADYSPVPVQYRHLNPSLPPDDIMPEPQSQPNYPYESLVEDLLQAFQLKLQVFKQENWLNLTLIQDPEQQVDQTVIIETIKQRLESRSDLDITQVRLGCRFYGSAQLNWKTEFEITPATDVLPIDEDAIDYPAQPTLIPTTELVAAEMTEFLESSLPDSHLRLQLRQKDEALTIVINHPAGHSFDFGAITRRLSFQIQSIQMPGVQKLDFYSRVEGSRQRDQEAHINLADLTRSSRSPESTAAISSQASIPPTSTEEVFEAPTISYARHSSAQKAPSPNPPAQKVPSPNPPAQKIPSPNPPAQSHPFMASFPSPAPMASLQPPAVESVLSPQTLELKPDSKPKPQPPPQKPAPGHSSSELNLSQYQFVRNKNLLTTALPNPEPAVGQLILFFHELSEADKRQVLPTLEHFFKDPTRTTRDHLPSPVQEWLNDIARLNDQKFKTVAVWLSRYCQNPSQALTAATANLKAVMAQVGQPAADKVQDEATITAIANNAIPVQATLYRASSHWITSLSAIFYGLCLTVSLLFAIPTGLSSTLLAWIGLASLPHYVVSPMGIILAAGLAKGLLSHKKYSVALTHSKIIVSEQRLLFKPVVSEFTLDAISNNIRVLSTGLGQMLNYGTISIQGKKIDPQFLFAISAPEELKNQIQYLKQQQIFGRQSSAALERSKLNLRDPNGPESGSPQERVFGEDNRYRLEVIIGQGGMGRVYRAMDRKLSIYVAIKFMLHGATASNEAVERFQREMQACISLQDPRIVKVLDYGFTGEELRGMESLPYLVMEYVAAPTLADILHRVKQFELKRAVNIGLQIAAALYTVHSGVILKGKRVQFIHRDLKPSNIFLIKNSDETETIKLADFGLVKFQGEVSLDTLSETGEFRGTVNFAAPEQCEGRRTIDTRADIYSLGCILYEMVAGTNPYGLPANATLPQWLYAHVYAKPLPLPKSLSVPPQLENIVMRCLAKEPSTRFNTSLEVQNALANSLDF